MSWSSHIAPAIVPVLLPVLFWAAYHYHKDRHLPEPPAHLFAAFVLGGLSFTLGALLYRLLGAIGLRFDASLLAESSPLGLLLYSIFAIGVIEELVKIVPFLLVIVRFREFNEPVDGIIYASFIALGFSAIENYQYLVYLSPGEAVARGIAGPVVHIVFASIWGYVIGRAWLARAGRVRAVCGALALAALLHGLYDFIAIGLPARTLPVAALLVLGIWVWRLRLIRDLHYRAGHA